MEVEQELWNVKLKPDTKTNVVDSLPAVKRNWTKLEIKHAALFHALSGIGVDRTTISVSESDEKEPVVLCTLVPVISERETLDLEFRLNGEAKCHFEVEGPNPVNVSGVLYWASPASLKSSNDNATSMNAQIAGIDPTCIKEGIRRGPKVSPPSSPLNASSLAVSRGPICSREQTNPNAEMICYGPSSTSGRDPRVSRPSSLSNMNSASMGPFESREYRFSVTPPEPRSTSKHSSKHFRSPPLSFRGSLSRHVRGGEFVTPPPKRRRYENDYMRDEYGDDTTRRR